MTIELSYDKKEELPKGHEELYTEKEEKWVLSEVKGMKTQDDVNKLNESLSRERNDHKESKAKLAPWVAIGQTPEEVATSLDRITELEATSKEGKIDEKEMTVIVEARTKAVLAPLQRERDKVDKELADFKTENAGLKNAEVRRTIDDEVRRYATDSKVIPGAVPDVLMIASQNFEILGDGRILTNEASGKQGMDVETWMKDIQTQKPYFWPGSVGGGATGSGAIGAGGKNPFTAEHWNSTEQSKLYKEKGQEATEQLAKMAGSSIGATKPPEVKK